MNYSETINYLFTSAPLFQNVGGDAYKEGLYNTHQLDEHFGRPHSRFKTVHVAGTNGKGSCSHTLAAILQASGLKVGLFTSPHLVDFRERIRVNGEMVSEQYVVDFVAEHRAFFEPLHPSFFELTTAMAFKYFAEQEVDVAVVEVGLGGRLDCTNIITPEVCVITNISFDHVMFLGNTLAKIAEEKAGIIKKNIPVVIGETVEETRPVFEAKAQEMGAPIFFAEEENEIKKHSFNKNNGINYHTNNYGLIHAELRGFCQQKNTATILCAVSRLKEHGFRISNGNVKEGFAHVCEMTGLMGRWQTLQTEPRVVCDTGHNTGGFQWIVQQLASESSKLKRKSSKLKRESSKLNNVAATLRIVFGMVNDKDISGVLSMMPKEATYYFCQASVKRALPHEEIKQKAAEYDLRGNSYPTVMEAYEAALNEATKEDFIYVGGSSFVVADLLVASRKH
ncbi:MAG: bifunctional folylpolyglutamate synthase/dihydrofolate synthase [Bacteroidaceae bacterium]|nr:bifunctional folylpolyglutamate synthase/dihydrofolate synthase [Bacteroidaceae bacterium]